MTEKEKESYRLDFQEYIRHNDSNLSKKEKISVWATAIGLQQVDGLTPSKYLYEIAKQNIEGDISFEEAKNLIDKYYENRTEKKLSENEDDRTEEADKVSSRIAVILSEPSFNFSPSYLISIHKRLFEGIFRFAGKLREYDISKNEWILDGESVMYGASFELKSALDYDFEQERNFNYTNLSKDEIVKHITFFVSRLWQIHPFGEGNTRTTALFTIKYLRSLGFEKADNKIFSENSWYFRNALVRANYSNLQKGIQENPIYLEKFFRNVILDEKNELKNRFTHLRYEEMTKGGAHDNVNDNVNDNANDSKKILEKTTAKLNSNQQKILESIKGNPHITQQELSEKLGITTANVNINMKKLQQNGIIKRIGADKNGRWELEYAN